MHIEMRQRKASETPSLTTHNKCGSTSHAAVGRNRSEGAVFPAG